MTYNTENFDSWIRGDFVHLNTALEELYFATENPEPRGRHERRRVGTLLEVIDL